MPANRMKAAVGSTLKVIGSSSAMVSAGPRPGSTPIAVPSVVPTRHQSRFVGVSAIAKPLRSCENASMSGVPPDAQRTLDRVADPPRAAIEADRACDTEIGDQLEGGGEHRIAHDRLEAEAARHAHEHDD